MDKANNTTVFTSLAQCSAATGYDKKILKTAKQLNAPGFHASNRILWDQLEPWLIANKTTIESTTDESLEHFKIEIAKRDVVLRDLEIQKKREEVISPDELKQFLSTLGTLVSSVLKKKREELMSKATGYELLIDKEFQEIFKLLDKELDSFINE